MTRIVLVTGKGGVGKSTVAAATAVHAAAAGHRVLVTSTDPAHSLGDAFDRVVGDRPTAVADRLDALQLHAQTRLQQHWRPVRDYLVGLLAWGGVSRLEAEELVVVPGLDELFALLDLRRRAGDGRYDLVVVDCAPTAETLRLLALPDALRWYVDRLLTPGRRVARAVRPAVARAGGPPVPPDEVLATVGRVHAALADVAGLLRDPDRTSVRLVLTPERMVIAESRRMATSLSLFGLSIDAVVVNRLVPDDVDEPWVAAWRRRQRPHVADVHASFDGTPVLGAPIVTADLGTLGALGELGARLHGDRDPAAVLHRAPPVSVEDGPDGPRLVIDLRSAGRDEVDLHRRGADLHVEVAGVRRVVALPAALRTREVVGAGIRDGVLEVRFGAVEAPASVVGAGP